MSLTFPILNGRDARYYSVEHENVVMRNKMEGGYVQTRARHTRSARRTFTTGYTQMTEADRQTLEAFWNSVRGGSKMFDWEDPITAEIHQVRFTDKPLKFKYAGVGGKHLWTIGNITLEEV